MADYPSSHARLMAASTDLLQQRPQQLHNTHSNPSTNPWGTWEELLLASAVQKHGDDNWTLVSAELQSRARASFSFTPEACRAEYQAIKLRFGAEEGREGNDMPWFEELRRLRVAHLRRELQQYDNSIGSLENKIKRLQSEKEKSERSLIPEGAKESGKTPTGPSEPPRNVVTDESAVSGSQKPCSHRAPASGVTSGHAAVVPSPGPASKHPNPDTAMAQPTHAHAKGQRNGWAFSGEAPGPTMAPLNGGEAPGSSRPQPNGGVEVASEQRALYKGKHHEKQGEQLQISESTVQLDITKSVARSLPKNVVLDQEFHDNGSRQHPAVAGEGMIIRGLVKVEQDVGGNESNTAEILTRNSDAGVSSQLLECSDMASARQTKQSNCIVTDMSVDSDLGGESGLPKRCGNRMLAVQMDCTVKPVVSQSLEASDIKEWKNAEKGKTMVLKDTEDDGDRKSEDSESLCSPRLKSSSLKRRRSVDGRGLGSGGETCLQDDDCKRLVCRVLAEKSVPEAKQSLPVESADSTEGKRQEVFSAKKFCQEDSTSNVKVEMLTSEDAVPESAALKSKGGHQSLASREPALRPLKLDAKNRSTSSTENSLLREVWGESAEVVDKETGPASKKGRFTGRGRKLKPTISITKDFEEERDATNPSTQVESSVKTESRTTSREASESMHAPRSKEGNDDETEMWHQMERFSGDSRVEKSEVGSFADGNEDISPMSRRNRREPKVAGKLIPLLESLRAVCAHKCAPLFKHSQEGLDNRRYQRLIRAPVDLGMIRAKLEEGQYSGSLHFFRDLLLMVSNALVYYPKDSPESAVASGLRECIMKEMRFVFETEALLKQEGPSFRKRDSGKARQLLTANQARRKALKTPYMMDTPTRDPAFKQSDISTSVDSRGHQTRKGLKTPYMMDTPTRDPAFKQSDISTSVDSRGHQNLAIRFEEGARAEKANSGKKIVSSPDARRVLDNQTIPKGADGLKLGPVPVEKANEPRDQESNKATAKTIPKDSKVKQRLADRVLNRKGGSAKAGITSITPVMASSKGVESSGRKTKVAPDIALEPVKRGVGRPPKHSQRQRSQRAKEVEEPNLPRKRVRR